jgi:outer membrane protein OmpA-like peptidoglycan-associated protein
MRSPRPQKCLLSTAAGLALAAAASSAFAQQPPLALDRFDPAPAGDRMFGVQSPFAAGSMTPHAMLLADYGHNPLVLRTTPNDVRAGSVVANQLFFHLDGGMSLWNRLNVNVDVPVALFQSGDNPTAGGQSFASPSKAQFGDLRLGARVRIWGEYFDPFQIAIGGYLWVPTGTSSPGSFVSNGQVRGLPQLILGGRTDRLVWSAAAGPDIRGAQTFRGVDVPGAHTSGGTEQGAMLKWGAGIGVLLLDDRRLQLGPEVSGAVTFRDPQRHTTNAEILLDLRYRVIDDMEIGAGVGPGLTSGIGTPDVRAVLMATFTPEQKKRDKDRDGDGIPDSADACPDEKGERSEDPKKNGCPKPKDRDGDGIPDAADACPDEPGVADPDPQKNGCPPPKDRDGDGILDAADACPDEKGVADPDPRKNGCPPPKDRDGDGIPDAADACPDEPGVADPDPKKNGCPPPKDRDGDGILDDVDACPDEKGVADPDPRRNGCSPSARVSMSDTEIFILEQVQFDTNKATIKKVSDPLLDEVAGVLRGHPDILRIEVQGHTDNRGTRTVNLALSQARAEAVVRALVKRGIAPGRLTAKGYGQSVPLVANVTDHARAKNRRVQFKILEKKPRAAP